MADPLLRANRIRTASIRFSLEAGETAGSWARQLGLCHPPAAVGEPSGLQAQHRGMNFADQEHCWEGAQITRATLAPSSGLTRLSWGQRSWNPSAGMDQPSRKSLAEIPATPAAPSLAIR